MELSLLSVLVCHMCLAAVSSFQIPTSGTSNRRTNVPVVQKQQNQCWGVSLSSRSKGTLLESTASPTTSKAESAQGDDDDGDESKDDTPTPSKQKDISMKDKTSVEDELKASFEELEKEKRLSMPWSQNQEWALRDNLPQYTIMVPLKSRNKNDDDAKKSTTVFALWRTMLKEVPELTGYPIDFLQERWADHDFLDNSDTKPTKNILDETPALLPYLEDYEFTPAGGISGMVYGIPGLAEGARIETSAVSNIEVTLTKGFICTSDGSAAYELGRPKREEFTDLASSLGETAKGGSYELLRTVNNGAKKLPSSSSVGMEDADGMLLRLGATTGILLAGATAMNMLAHHLTVNVFWV